MLKECSYMLEVDTGAAVRPVSAGIVRPLPAPTGSSRSGNKKCLPKLHLLESGFMKLQLLRQEAHGNIRSREFSLLSGTGELL
jgi:hypothetical protein